MQSLTFAQMRQLCKYIYAFYTFTAINNVTETLIYIDLTLLAYAPVKICLQHCTYMSHITTIVIYYHAIFIYAQQ